MAGSGPAGVAMACWRPCPPTGLGFPTGMANVLRVGMGTGTFDWVEANNQWTLPAIGESRAFRLYLRNDVGAVEWRLVGYSPGGVQGHRRVDQRELLRLAHRVDHRFDLPDCLRHRGRLSPELLLDQEHDRLRRRHAPEGRDLPAGVEVDPDRDQHLLARHADHRSLRDHDRGQLDDQGMGWVDAWHPTTPGSRWTRPS